MIVDNQLPFTCLLTASVKATAKHTIHVIDCFLGQRAHRNPFVKAILMISTPLGSLSSQSGLEFFLNTLVASQDMVVKAQNVFMARD